MSVWVYECWIYVLVYHTYQFTQLLVKQLDIYIRIKVVTHRTPFRSREISFPQLSSLNIKRSQLIKH